MRPRRRPLPAERKLERYRRFTRTHGTNPLVRSLVLCVVGPFVRHYFRLRHEGFEHTPADGALIIASNHRSFLDPFLIGALLPAERPLHFMAKAELFRIPVVGWLLNRLGAFPVRRGESDAKALRTAEAVLERGGVLVIFPEGTRMRAGGLGRPKRGAARLALATGADIMPVVLQGTENARRGPIVRPVRITAHALDAILVEQDIAGDRDAAPADLRALAPGLGPLDAARRKLRARPAFPNQKAAVPESAARTTSPERSAEREPAPAGAGRRD